MSLAPFLSEIELGEFLRLDLDDSDALATLAIEAGSQSVRDDLHQQVNTVEADAVSLDGIGNDALLLPELPVTAVTSVTVVTRDSEGAVSEELLLVDEVDYHVGEGGILWRLLGNDWTWGHGNIAVVYDHGYDPDDDLPPIIKAVAAQAAGRFYMAEAAVPAAESDRQERRTMSVSLTEGERRAIARYRVGEVV